MRDYFLWAEHWGSGWWWDNLTQRSNSDRRGERRTRATVSPQPCFRGPVTLSSKNIKQNAIFSREYFSGNLFFQKALVFSLKLAVLRALNQCKSSLKFASHLPGFRIQYGDRERRGTWYCYVRPENFDNNDSWHFWQILPPRCLLKLIEYSVKSYKQWRNWPPKVKMPKLSALEFLAAWWCTSDHTAHAQYSWRTTLLF